AGRHRLRRQHGLRDSRPASVAGSASGRPRGSTSIGAPIAGGPGAHNHHVARGAGELGRQPDRHRSHAQPSELLRTHEHGLTSAPTPGRRARPQRRSMNSSPTRVPGNRCPGETRSETMEEDHAQTAPEQTAPEQTAPEQTAPEQTAPEQTTPANISPAATG